MNVQDLIKRLSAYPPNMPVYFDKGNFTLGHINDFLNVLVDMEEQAVVLSELTDKQLKDRESKKKHGFDHRIHNEN